MASATNALLMSSAGVPEKLLVVWAIECRHVSEELGANIFVDLDGSTAAAAATSAHAKFSGHGRPRESRMAKMHVRRSVGDHARAFDRKLGAGGQGHHWRGAMIQNKQAELWLILIHASGKHRGCGDTEWSLTIVAGRVWQRDHRHWR